MVLNFAAMKARSHLRRVRVHVLALVLLYQLLDGLVRHTGPIRETALQRSTSTFIQCHGRRGGCASMASNCLARAGAGSRGRALRQRLRRADGCCLSDSVAQPQRRPGSRDAPSHSLSNEAIEIVDANGLARDALGRANSHANPEPRNRPVKNANARLGKWL